jgi:type IV fimbrial biogenesis protein FimT
MKHVHSHQPAASVNPTRRQRGVTVLESLIAVSVTAVALGSAVPGFEQARERRHLEGAAAQLETDILYTRSMAVAQDRGLRIQFRSESTGTCYVVHSGAAGACQCGGDGTTQCTAGTMVLRSAHFIGGGPVAVRANVGSILFHPVHGTSTPTGTLRITTRSGAAVHHVVNIMGRVRSCSPNGVSGYVNC